MDGLEALCLHVFSAQAEVFPVYDTVHTVVYGFLRASGGVSGYVAYSLCHDSFSPRKRRCFPVTSASSLDGSVFSAQAEVFLDDAPCNF